MALRQQLHEAEQIRFQLQQQIGGLEHESIMQSLEQLQKQVDEQQQKSQK